MPLAIFNRAAMRIGASLASVVAVMFAQSVTVTGQASITGNFAIGNASFTPLTAPAVTSMGFSPSSALTGLPKVELSDTLLVPSAGYQSGAFVNGEMIYYPWMVANGGSNWQEQIEFGIPQSVILSYTPGMPGISQFPTIQQLELFRPLPLELVLEGRTAGIEPGCKQTRGISRGRGRLLRIRVPRTDRQRRHRVRNGRHAAMRRRGVPCVHSVRLLKAPN